MICSIHQPQSFPWLGFFAKIYSSDIFILLDNVQFKKNEFQNRNKIKINDDWKWFTVPVKYKFGQLIFEIEINNNSKWKKKHINTLKTVYGKTPYFEKYIHELINIYNNNYKYLSLFNIDLINWILSKLSINTKIYIASQIISIDEIKNENATNKLIKLINKVDCSTYLSGVGGKNYLDENLMIDNKIKIEYQRFNHPHYYQKGDNFISNLSILDLLFNEGGHSLHILKKGIK